MRFGSIHVITGHILKTGGVEKENGLSWAPLSTEMSYFPRSSASPIAGPKSSVEGAVACMFRPVLTAKLSSRKPRKERVRASLPWVECIDPNKQTCVVSLCRRCISITSSPHPRRINPRTRQKSYPS